MFLKAIEIYGFKSFGDRVVIDFNRGITSIVGPNGSGKSNILDAVLWVLGEQSYKSIRAKESQDIIFSGGKNKKSMSSAEVSLYIDNSDKFLPNEEEEIKITRKIKITGENEYYINDTRRRLKDIGSVFLDTGIGKNAYSIIGQGKVERIINSSPKEIKNIIEEAAGIKKYQFNKAEATKNLSNLDNELEKVELILNEVRENKNKVEKQAIVAKEYLDIKNQRSSLAKGIFVCEVNKKTLDLLDMEKNKITSSEKCEELDKKFNGINERLEFIDKEKLEVKTDIETITNKNTKLRDFIAENEKEKVRITERIKGFKRELEEKNAAKLSLDEKIIEKKSYIDGILSKISSAKNKIEEIEDGYKDSEERIKKIDDSIKFLIDESEAKSSKIKDLEIEKLTLINEIESSAKRVSSTEFTLKNLNSNLEDIKNNIKENQTLSLKAEKTFSKNKESLTTILERNQFIENEVTSLSIRMNNLLEDIRNHEYNEKRFSSKLEALIRLDESNEGFYKGVKDVLNSDLKGIEGVFISLISIPEKYEKAIETAAAGNLQDIVVANNDIAKKAIALLKQLKSGRASFLALDILKTNKRTFSGKIKGVLGIASDLVNFDKKYQKAVDFVLGNLLIVENIDIAIDILKKDLFSGNIVSLDGEVVSSRGRISGGETKKSPISAIMERKKEIKTLTVTVSELKDKITNSNEEQAKINKDIVKYENEMDEIELKENNIRKQVKISEDSYEDLVQKSEKYIKEKNVIEAEITEENRYLEEFKKRIDNSKSETEKVEDFIKTLKEEILTDKEKIKSETSLLEKENKDFADTRMLYLNTKNNLEHSNTELEKENKELEVINENMTSAIERIKSLGDDIVNLNNSELEIISLIDEKLSVYQDENKDIETLKKRDIDLSKEERDLSKDRNETESFLLHANDKLTKITENIEKIELEIERINEEMESLEDVVETPVEFEKIKSSKDKLKSFDNKLNNFGNINLLAIEEFEELKEKYNFLGTQRDDVVKGRKVLLELIQEIDETIHERFSKAYTEINDNFNQMCVETIDNSEGRLNMINPENFDDSGIEISVKFKNKKRQALSLLSGGEKSMVAIAFIMSIFMYKPSPFTFLDEIEAALDEKNTKKLINKLKEFTDRSQFILITHNKDTMTESHSIFGVTMNKEIGISKIVPVKF